MTTGSFPFDAMERALEVSDQKIEDVVKVLVAFTCLLDGSVPPPGSSGGGTRNNIPEATGTLRKRNR